MGLGSPRLGLGVGKWPLVGPEKELSQLTAPCGVAQRGAVITGAAGVSKTTLAMTGLRVAEKRGCRWSALPLPGRRGGCRSGRWRRFCRLTRAVMAWPGRTSMSVDTRFSFRADEGIPLLRCRQTFRTSSVSTRTRYLPIIAGSRRQDTAGERRVHCAHQPQRMRSRWSRPTWTASGRAIGTAWPTSPPAPARGRRIYHPCIRRSRSGHLGHQVSSPVTRRYRPP